MSGSSVDQVEGGWKEEEFAAHAEKANAIIKIAPGLAIVPMGARKDIREMAYRIQRMAPGGMKYTPAECVVLAQYSISMQANPLAGEVYLMKNQNTGEVLGLTPGIRLFRRKADEQDKSNNDFRWVECYPLDIDERALYLVPEGAMAYKAHLRMKSIMSSYAETAERLAKAGAKWDDIKHALGDHPYVEGIGVITKEEMAAFDRNSRNKMPHIERCKKRAEAAALKVKYHLDYGFIPLQDGAQVDYGSSLADDFIDVQARVISEEDEAEGISKVKTMMDDTEGVVQEGKEVSQPSAMYPESIDKTSLSGTSGKADNPTPNTAPVRPYDPENMKIHFAVRADIHAKDGDKASEKFRGLMCSIIESCFDPEDKATKEKKRHSILAYLTGKDSMKDVPDWYVYALKDWLNFTQDSGGLYVVDPMAIKEARKIIEKVLVEAGQQTLPEEE